VAGGTPATAERRGWCPTNRNMMNENFIFRQPHSLSNEISVHSFPPNFFVTKYLQKIEFDNNLYIIFAFQFYKNKYGLEKKYFI